MNVEILSDVRLVKETKDYYPYYEKLIKMSIEEPIAETPEYKVLAEGYPHLAESIKLKREVKRLKEKLRSLEERSKRSQMNREILRIETKLKRENIQKRLHGESKQEAIFKTSSAIATSKERVSSLASNARDALRKAYADIRSVDRSLRRSMHRKLPPSIFDLRSLDTAERGLAVKEWLLEHHRKRQKVGPSSSIEVSETPS